MSVDREPVINTLAEYEVFNSEFQSKVPNLSNEMSFWLTLYNDIENNPHFLRTEQLKNLIPGWDWEDEKDWDLTKTKSCFSCFNDFYNMFKYSYDYLGELKLLDQQIFKYYYRKIREFRNAGGVFNENNEIYVDFCNYFEVMI